MTLVGWAALAFAGYFLGLAFYRLYFSPLARAKIPGPRLAALSKFYEAYFEIVKQGKLSFKLDELHEQLGERSSLCPIAAWRILLIPRQVLSFASRPRKSISETLRSGTRYTSSIPRPADTRRPHLGSATMTPCSPSRTLASTACSAPR